MRLALALTNLLATVTAVVSANGDTTSNSTSETEQQGTCHVPNLTTECEKYYEKACYVPGLDDLNWGELTTECQNYWVSINHTMITWDKDHYWSELHPLSQKYWIESEDKTAAEWDLEQFEWDDLPKKLRDEYKRIGWNEEAWFHGDDDLKSFINEEELDWDELPPERLSYWIERGYDKEKWESSDDCANIVTKGRSFDPFKVKLSIPELEAITIDGLGSIDTEVGLRDGYTKDDNESYIGKTHMKDYIRELRAGTRRYLAMEDLDPYKKAFEEKVGGSVYRYLFDALNNSAVIKEKGVFTPEEWNTEHYDWAMFMGSKGTSTSMHYDNDLFNVLWVSEGRKRVVLIPNDERTEGEFDIVSAFSGTAHTGMDILDRSVPLHDLAVEIEIGPGEGIYFPYMCWHAVENLEDTLAFGWRVKDGY